MVDLKIMEKFFPLTSVAIGDVVPKMLDSCVVNASVNTIISLESDNKLYQLTYFPQIYEPCSTPQ